MTSSSSSGVSLPVEDTEGVITQSLQQQRVVLAAAVEARCAFLANVASGASACPCSYDQCLSTPPDDAAVFNNKTYGLDEHLCGTCGIKTFNQTSVEIVSTLQHSQTAAMSQELCASTVFDATLKDTVLKNNGTILASEFLSVSGVKRKYPGEFAGKCSISSGDMFAPYVDLTSGPMDVVILLDVSDSMNYHSETSRARELSRSILSSVGEDSYANVVYFSNKLEPIYPSLVRVSQNSLVGASAAICNKKFKGGTKFKNAFEEAFKELKAAHNSGQTSYGNPVIIMLTDGDIKDRRKDLLRNVRDWNDEYQSITGRRASIITFGLGNIYVQDVETLSKVSCENMGVYMKFDDDIPMNLKLNAHKSLFEQARTAYQAVYNENKRLSHFNSGPDLESQVHWSDVFDYNGIKAVRASLPVYSSVDTISAAKANSTFKPLAGYSSVIVRYDYILKNSTNGEELINGIPKVIRDLKAKYVIPPFRLTTTQLNLWRSSVGHVCTSDELSDAHYPSGFDKSDIPKVYFPDNAWQTCSKDDIESSASSSSFDCDAQHIFPMFCNTNTSIIYGSSSPPVSFIQKYRCENVSCTLGDGNVPATFLTQLAGICGASGTVIPHALVIVSLLLVSILLTIF